MTHDAVGMDNPERYGLARTGVILTGHAVFKGWAITTTLWLAGFCALTAVFSHEFSFSLLLMIIMFGYGIGLVLGLPIGWVVGYLLRPIRRQLVHVAAFFVLPTLTFWVLSSVLGFGWTMGGLAFWATVGAAAALGRLAVWKDAVIR